MEDRVPTAEDIARASLELDKLKRCFIIDDWLSYPQICMLERHVHTKEGWGQFREFLWRQAINEFWHCAKLFEMEPRNTDDLIDMAFIYNSAVEAYEHALKLRRSMVDHLIEVDYRGHVIGATSFQQALQTHWRRRGFEVFDPRAEERVRLAPWPFTARQAEVAGKIGGPKDGTVFQLEAEGRWREARELWERAIFPWSEQLDKVKRAKKWLQSGS